MLPGSFPPWPATGASSRDASFRSAVVPARGRALRGGAARRLLRFLTRRASSVAQENVPAVLRSGKSLANRQKALSRRRRSARNRPFLLIHEGHPAKTAVFRRFPIAKSRRSALGLRHAARFGIHCASSRAGTHRRFSWVGRLKFEVGRTGMRWSSDHLPRDVRPGDTERKRRLAQGLSPPDRPSPDSEAKRRIASRRQPRLRAPACCTRLSSAS